MDEAKTPSVALRLVNEAGLKRSYAYMIVSGDRTPSLRVAAQIYRATKLKFGPLTGATDAQCRALANLPAAEARAA